MNRSVSVLTIAHNRAPAVRNLFMGLAASTVKPRELVIVYMNDVAYDLPEAGIPVREVFLQKPGALPLAEARNLGVESAGHEHLIFLDADCIPAKNLVQAYQEAFLRDDEVLWSGPVRYLGPGAVSEPALFDRLEELSKPDPVRNEQIPLTHELFWSLNFGCSKSAFRKIGGFDAGFSGYGAEDTDFAFSARNRDIGINWLPSARAYHQHHRSYDPPLNHFSDIVANARRFYQKWQKWPMSGWLKKFQDLGLIEWRGDRIDIVRAPSNEEISHALK